MASAQEENYGRSGERFTFGHQSSARLAEPVPSRSKSAAGYHGDDAAGSLGSRTPVGTWRAARVEFLFKERHDMRGSTPHSDCLWISKSQRVQSAVLREPVAAGGRCVMRVRQFNIHELTPHPLNQKIYGTVKPDAELLKSVAENGVLQPLILDSKQTILAGHRRWMACKILAKRHSKKLVRTNGYENVPCVVSQNKGLDAERVLIEANRQRIKTAQQRIREFKELKRIETELAKERMSAGDRK